MNNFDHGRTSESDARLDSFLTEFYRRELPDELSCVSDRPLRSVPAAIVEPGYVRRRGLVGAAIVAASLLAAFSAFRTHTDRNQPPHPTVVDGNRTNVSPPHEPVVAPSPTVKPTETAGYSVSERTVPIERFQYDTSDGPVEQRTKLKTTSVSIIDPQTGAKVEVTLPELTIEIFPIDDEKEK